MKVLGLIGGMSWESTAVYYRLLNQMARDELGGNHSARLLVWSFDFAEIEQLQAGGDWSAATRAMVEAGRALVRGGAEALVICTNTMHRMADEVGEGCGVPLIHIADATGAEIRRLDIGKPLLLATRFTMEQNFYRARLLDRTGVAAEIPAADDRADVHRIIYQELCQGEILEASKRRYLSIIDQAGRAGCDGIIFGCTEIGLLLRQSDVDLPVIDTTEVHARAALDFALGR